MLEAKQVLVRRLKAGAGAVDKEVPGVAGEWAANVEMRASKTWC